MKFYFLKEKKSQFLRHLAFLHGHIIFLIEMFHDKYLILITSTQNNIFIY